MITVSVESCDKGRQQEGVCNCSIRLSSHSVVCKQVLDVDLSTYIPFCVKKLRAHAQSHTQVHIMSCKPERLFLPCDEIWEKHKQPFGLCISPSCANLLHHPSSPNLGLLSALMLRTSQQTADGSREKDARPWWQQDLFEFTFGLHFMWDTGMCTWRVMGWFVKAGQKEINETERMWMKISHFF